MKNLIQFILIIMLSGLSVNLYSSSKKKVYKFDDNVLIEYSDKYEEFNDDNSTFYVNPQNEAILVFEKTTEEISSLNINNLNDLKKTYFESAELIVKEINGNLIDKKIEQDAGFYTIQFSYFKNIDNEKNKIAVKLFNIGADFYIIFYTQPKEKFSKIEKNKVFNSVKISENVLPQTQFVSKSIGNYNFFRELGKLVGYIAIIALIIVGVVHLINKDRKYKKAIKEKEAENKNN